MDGKYPRSFAQYEPKLGLPLVAWDPSKIEREKEREVGCFEEEETEEESGGEGGTKGERWRVTGARASDYHNKARIWRQDASRPYRPYASGRRDTHLIAVRASLLATYTAVHTYL